MAFSYHATFDPALKTSLTHPTEGLFVRAFDGRYIRCDDLQRYEATRKRHQEIDRQVRLKAMGEALSQLDKVEYGEEIVGYMVEMEASIPALAARVLLTEQQLKTIPDVASIDIQTEIKWFMRPYLLDFLIEAHGAFGLLDDTLFLAINILDRYCSKRIVYRRHYQLVGCTALLIAAKYGECTKKVPHIADLAKMCCSLYDENMFTQMERHVLVTLEWAIGHTTVDSFLQLALNDGPGPMDMEAKSMALYIAEIALYHKDFVAMRSSDLAKVSLALAREILGLKHDEWTANCDGTTMVHLSQHLHRPSKILFAKYQVNTAWCVSYLLEDFLHKHALPFNAPPTPPSDVSPSSRRTPSLTYGTPSKKRKHSESMPSEPITPPITPENECDVDYITGRVTKRMSALSAPKMRPLSGQPPHHYYL
jgi:hypothetical protein